MRVAVMSPVRNAAEHVRETVASITNQVALHAENRLEVLYVVQDGDSDDATLEIVEDEFSRSSADRIQVSLDSSPDTGMYHALARAMRVVENNGGADWYCYLNAGDTWDPHCLSILMAAHAQTKEDWICGLHTYYSAYGPIVHTRLPFRYTQPLLRKGAYGRGLPTVQQESTFWRSSLQKNVDLDALETYRLAGDAYLWWTFAATATPAIIEATMAGFRYHGDHLGMDLNAYRDEIARFAGPLSATTRAAIATERILWEQPARAKARLNPHLYLYRTSLGAWQSQYGLIAPA